MDDYLKIVVQHLEQIRFSAFFQDYIFYLKSQFWLNGPKTLEKKPYKAKTAIFEEHKNVGNIVISVILSKIISFRCDLFVLD